MTDPLSPSDTDQDGGLNASDSLDWQDRKREIAGTTRIFLALGGTLILMMVLFAGAMYWKLYLSKPATLTAPVTAAAAPLSDKDAQIAQLQGQLLRLQGQLASPAAPVQPGVVPTAPVYAADAAALAQLSARLDRLEANQRALSRAAAAADAAASLQQKAHGSAPFMSELIAVEPAFDDPSLTAPLRAIAEKGVPSEVQLAIEFPIAAAKANIAAKADSDDDNLFNRARHALGSFISVRRTDNTMGNGTEAKLARAEIQLNAGDLDGALAYLGTLPPSAQKALKPWLDKAHARSLVDDTTRRITQMALARLVQANDGAQAAVSSQGGAL